VTGEPAASAVLVEGRGTDLWIVTLNRAANRNAIDEELQIALVEVMHELADDSSVRAAVFTGAGVSFSAGGDVALIRHMQADTDIRRAVLERSRVLFQALCRLEIPMVCALNGPAVGAGCTLALSCDIVVMSEDAYLREPRVPLGLVPGDGGTVFWTLLAGLPAARAYLLTGERLSASDAHRLGIAHRIVRPGDLLETASGLAESLARLPPPSVRAMKRLLNDSMRAVGTSQYEAMCAEEALMDSAEHRAAIDELFGPPPDRGEHG
jgi:enoyl-CoA hydratase